MYSVYIICISSLLPFGRYLREFFNPFFQLPSFSSTLMELLYLCRPLFLTWFHVAKIFLNTSEIFWDCLHAFFLLPVTLLLMHNLCSTVFAFYSETSSYIDM